ncbi:phosphotransferase [Poriferisphaera corsica]|nr:phosphotransferase [Poriferisphaera corsica]
MLSESIMVRRQELDREKGFVWLDLEGGGDIALIEDLLRRRGWIGGRAKVEKIEQAGEGNMNLVMRVYVKGNEGRGESGRRMILKQGRPWVEKYPEIAAPWERVGQEYEVYRVIRDIVGVREWVPGVVGYDDGMRMLGLEDLGEGLGIDAFYQGKGMDEEEVDWLAGVLKRLHGAELSKEVREGLQNEDMRRLNYEYLFVQPLNRGGENDERLDGFEKGLLAVVKDLRRDEPLREGVRELGEIYMDVEGRGGVLLHGDYYPGSWHRPIKVRNESIRGRRGVLDWEFSFVGHRSVDLGVFVGHAAMSKQKIDVVERFLAVYESVGDSVMSGFAGNEVIRRLAGVAQLPIEKSDGWRAEMLVRAREAIVNGDWRALWR